MTHPLYCCCFCLSLPSPPPFSPQPPTPPPLSYQVLPPFRMLWKMVKVTSRVMSESEFPPKPYSLPATSSYTYHKPIIRSRMFDYCGEFHFPENMNTILLPQHIVHNAPVRACSQSGNILISMGSRSLQNLVAISQKYCQPPLTIKAGCMGSNGKNWLLNPESSSQSEG